MVIKGSIIGVIKGGIIGVIKGSVMVVIKGDTSSLGYSSFSNRRPRL